MDAAPLEPFISTGDLPRDELVRSLVDHVHARFRTNAEGAVSSVYPALEQMPPDLFAIAVASVAGIVYATGDVQHHFSIMSVSKPFVFALVCEAIGIEEARQRLGVNSTGLPFNSLEAVERSSDGRTNPMVNPGAIAATSMAPGRTTDDKWIFLHDGLSAFAGRDLALNEDVYASASATNHRNRELAALVHRRGVIYSDPVEATDLYTRQCSLNVTATDLAVMGATLAHGGVNPRTGKRVVSANACRNTLAVMATSGLYETSGDWLWDIGLPGKSGIGGGIVTVSPGKGGLGTFAPRLDAAGNSVKGQLAASLLSRILGLDLFAS